MNMGETGDRSSSAKINRLQISLVTQLLQIATNAHHMDDVFHWLAYAMVDHFDIQVIQFWTNHVNMTGHRSVQLRTMVRQDASLPEQVMVNDQVALVIQQLANERQSAKLMPVDNVFLLYQATLFKRYGLNYCLSFFITRNVFIPPHGNALSPGALTPLALTSLCLLRQSPHIDLLPAINNILNQALTIGSNRGLLPPASEDFSSYHPGQPAPQRGAPPVLPSLSELVPHRRQDPNLLMSSNPFAASAVIADKQARRLYGAIDGHTNVAALCNSMRMDIREIHAALQILLKLQRIELHGSDGQLINPSPFFKNL